MVLHLPTYQWHEVSLKVPYLVLYCLACMLMIFLMQSHLVTLQCLRMILNSLIKEIHTTQDCKLLQNDLDQLQTLSENSGLKFNASKCNSQMITRKLKPTTHVYKLYKNKLIQTDCERDLGVFVDRNLTWNRQVIEQSSKANKQLEYIKRSTIYVGNVEVKRSLYLTLVRPFLGYATQIWAPQSAKLIQHLERIQRRATKYILNLPFSTSVEYTTRLKTLNLLPICYWH